MPYLESLRVFCRIVERGSITAGGRDLRLTPAVASNRLRELEDRLGARLFNRTTRSLTPTDVGREFYDHARKVIEALEDAEAMVAGFSDRPRGALRVAAPLGVGRAVVAAAVPAFRRAWPEIDIRLRLTDRRVDLMEDELDMAVFVGQPAESALKMRKFADAPRVLAAAPDYLAARGRPERPEDLLRHDCLLLRYPRSPEYFWTFETGDGPRKLEVSGPADTDSTEVLVDWARAGLGIVNRPRFELVADLASGALVELLPENPPEPAIFGCLTPHRRLQDPKVRLFADHVGGAARDWLRQRSGARAPQAAG